LQGLAGAPPREPPWAPTRVAAYSISPALPPLERHDRVGPTRREPFSFSQVDISSEHPPRGGHVTQAPRPEDELAFGLDLEITDSRCRLRAPTLYDRYLAATGKSPFGSSLIMGDWCPVARPATCVPVMMPFVPSRPNPALRSRPSLDCNSRGRVDLSSTPNPIRALAGHHAGPRAEHPTDRRPQRRCSRQ
jgi:hypothetical protein